MKKAFRILLGLIIGLGALLLLLLFVCLERVDFRPYMRQPYYTKTAATLRAEEATNTIVHGTLEAGFGRALLSPKLNATEDEPAQGKFRSLALAGYGDRHGKPATGVHDDVYVKAVAFRVNQRLGIMLGADALIVPPEVTEQAVQRLSQELKLSRDQLYLSATHTHSSIGGWGEGKVGEAFAGKYQPGARLWFADRIVTAVREAVADLKPAELGQGHFAAGEFVRNRLVGELGRVDPEFSYVLVKQPGGKSGVLGSFAAHATVLSGAMMEVSADYPGCWQRAVEQATGGLAVFLAGGVGSHSPAPGAPGFAGAEKMGQALAQALLERLPQTPMTNTIAFGTLGLEVWLPPLNTRMTDGVRLRPWLAKRLLSRREQTYLEAFRLQDVVWVSTPCDFSGELALGIKDYMQCRGSRTVITSFNGDYIGYVILPRYYHMDGYEPRLMSFFGPNVPDYLDELIRSMAGSLAKN